MKKFGVILFGLTLLLPQVVEGQKTANPPFADGSNVTYKFNSVEPGSNGREGPYVATFPATREATR